VRNPEGARDEEPASSSRDASRFALQQSRLRPATDTDLEPGEAELIFIAPPEKPTSRAATGTVSVPPSEPESYQQATHSGSGIAAGVDRFSAAEQTAIRTDPQMQSAKAASRPRHTSNDTSRKSMTRSNP